MIYKRGKKKNKNIYWYEFVFNGKRIRESTHLTNAKDARQIEAARKTQLAKGEVGFVEPLQAPIFTEYADEWLDDHAKTYCKYSTWTSYSSVIENHLKPFFKTKRIDEITRQDVQELIRKKLKSGAAKATVRNVLAPLREMLNHAIDRDDLPVASNPANRAGRYLSEGGAKKNRAKISPLTREEVQTVISTAAKFEYQTYTLILCASRTGLRMGEIFGLKWGDIDFDEQFVEVRRSIVRGRVGTPKNGHLRRVDMSGQLAKAFKELKRTRTEESFQAGKEMPGWVFVNGVGNPLDQNNLRNRIFYKVLDAAKVRRIRFHDLRHTFASLLLQQGESVTYVKEQLGHQSIKMTVDVYGHLIPGSNKQAVDRLDDVPAVGA